MVILYLTCANQTEADTITQALLETHAVACVRSQAVNSAYWWDKKIEHAAEVLLMMESVEDKFEDINTIVSTLHSYDEYVLTMVQATKTTPGVERWLAENIE